MNMTYINNFFNNSNGYVYDNAGRIIGKIDTYSMSRTVGNLMEIKGTIKFLDVIPSEQTPHEKTLSELEHTQSVLNSTTKKLAKANSDIIRLNETIVNMDNIYVKLYKKYDTLFETHFNSIKNHWYSLFFAFLFSPAIFLYINDILPTLVTLWSAVNIINAGDLITVSMMALILILFFSTIYELILKPEKGNKYNGRSM